MLTRLFASAVALLCLSAALAAAQPIVFETEPNDDLLETAQPDVIGEARLRGEVTGSDQDGFWWVLGEADAGRQWDIVLRARTEGLIQIDLVRLDADPDILAEAGLEEGFTGQETLLRLQTVAGRPETSARALIIPEGRYAIGLSNAGGGGDYEVELSQSGGARSFTTVRTNDEGQGEDTDFPAGNSRIYTIVASEQSIGLDIGEPGEDEDAPRLWRVAVQGEVGQSLRAWVEDADGETIAGPQTGSNLNHQWGRLALEPGAVLRLAGDAETPIGRVRIGLTGDGQASSDAEIEPNDSLDRANWIEAGAPVSAVSDGRGDQDWFAFTVDEDAAERTQDITVRFDHPRSLRVCLAPVDGSRRELCRTTPGDDDSDPVFGGLQLEAGDHAVKVQGTSDDVYDYEIEVRWGDPAPATAAIEPNDHRDWAAPLGARPVRGRIEDRREAWFAFDVTGAPQLWRFQANGDAIQNIQLRRAGSGQEVARTGHTSGGAPIKRIDNVRLLPGRYLVSVTGERTDYLLRAIALGEPDPSYAIEPNDDAANAQPLLLGERMQGTYTDSADAEVFAFSLPGFTRVRMRIEPPAGVTMRATMSWAGEQVMNTGRFDEARTYELMLPKGDYIIDARADEGSELEYGLSVEPVSPWAPFEGVVTAISAGLAMPLEGGVPADGMAAGGRGSEAWLALPRSAEDRVVSLRQTDERWDTVTVHDAALQAVDELEGEGDLEVRVPAGESWLLHRGNRGGGGTLFVEDPALSPPGADAQATLNADADAVAAFRPEHQTVTVSLDITNGGEDTLVLPVSFAVSHEHAEIDAETDVIELAPGETGTVGARITLPPEMADRTAATVWARAGSALAELSLPIETGADPAGPDFRPDPPEDLAGLPDLAWSPLGARWLDADTGEITEWEYGSINHLTNGFTNTDLGFRWNGEAGESLPVLRLAGRGGEIHALIFDGRNQIAPLNRWREVEVEASTDGESFESIARVRLSPADGPVLHRLETPVQASHLRLTPLSSWGPWPRSATAIGAFSVIGAPDPEDPAFGALDLFEPELGGHVVHGWTAGEDHVLGAFATSNVRAGRNGEVDAVLGFHNHRLARLASLEMAHHPEAEDDMRPVTISVQTSESGAAGPWTDHGEWDVSDGDTAEMAFDAPVQARYVRLATTVDTTGWFDPPVFRAIEADTVASGESILGHHGDYAMTGPHETAGDPLAGLAEGDLDLSSAPDAPMPLEAPVRGRVERPHDTRAYAITVPEGENTIAVTLSEAAGGRLRATLTGPDGTVHELDWAEAEGLARTGIASGLEPGEHRLDVTEPMRSVVMVWDNSGSVSHHRPAIERAMAELAEGLNPDEEAANIIVLGGPPLIDGWAVGANQVYEAIAADPGSFTSSQAEDGLHAANDILKERDGQRIVILIADAELASGRNDDLWPGMPDAMPRVYALGLDSQGATHTGKLRLERNLMQSWAQVNGGDYSYNSGREDLLRAFRSAMIDMRRPSEFVAAAETRWIDPPEPGALSVVSTDEPVLGAGALHLIFDASGSMLQRMEGGRRIEVARAVARETIERRVPAGVPIALRAFGHTEPDSCETELLVSPAADNHDAVLSAVDGIQAVNLARTPLAASLAAVPGDLSGYQSERQLVVMLTDGEETCDGNLEAELERLLASGVQVRLNIVGFHIDESGLREEFARLAGLGGGVYFDTRDGEGLQTALSQAMAAEFTVLDAGGNTVAEGRVDGDPVTLDAGRYSLEIEGREPQEIEIEPSADLEVAL